MTPLHLSIYMHHHISLAEYSPRTRTSEEYTSDLVRMGLLAEALMGSGTIALRPTEKGRVWFERVLSTPMPVQKWVFEDSLDKKDAKD